MERPLIATRGAHAPRVTGVRAPRTTERFLISVLHRMISWTAPRNSRCSGDAPSRTRRPLHAREGARAPQLPSHSRMSFVPSTARWVDPHVGNAGEFLHSSQAQPGFGSPKPFASLSGRRWGNTGRGLRNSVIMIPAGKPARLLPAQKSHPQATICFHVRCVSPTS